MVNKIIEGVGEDAEVVVNEKGGKQSKTPMALHLIDSAFLYHLFHSKYDYSAFIDYITDFMESNTRDTLIKAVKALAIEAGVDAVVEIGKVLQYGAEKYEANNWRLIPQEEHINHALIHYYAARVGDTQDQHIAHCLCRLMMAYATEKSDKFDYCKYVM